MEQILKVPSSEFKKSHAPYSGKKTSYGWHTLVWFIIALGISIRLFHFFYNRSFWTDEAYLGNSLIRMDFLELIKPPLEYEQKAPVGFLWLSRLAILLFGKGEMALRLVPLLSGIISLLVFKKVANYFLKPVAFVIAMLVIALAPPLVYFSVEAKQYSTELLASIIVLYLFIRYKQQIDIKSLLIWGFWGAIIIWFSFSSIFMLAGMAIALSFNYLINKNWKYLFWSILPFSMWLFSFAVNYFLFTYKFTDSEWLALWFKNRRSFMPFPLTSLKDLNWFFITLHNMVHYAVGLCWVDTPDNAPSAIKALFRVPLVPVISWAVGLILFFRKDRLFFWVLVFPFLLAMLASGLEKYPMYERLMLFLVPSIILFVARGCEKLMALLPKTNWRYVLPVLLLLGGLTNTGYMVANPSLLGRPNKNMTGRQALLYVNDRFQPGDMVYVYWNFQPVYRFYKEAYQLKYNAVIGQDVRLISKDSADYLQNLGPDLDKLRGGKRVWFIYNRFRRFTIGDYIGQPSWYYKNNAIPGKIIYHKLAAMGKEIDTYQNQEMSVVLFDLKTK
jgi:hypothetical protein